MEDRLWSRHRGHKSASYAVGLQLCGRFDNSRDRPNTGADFPGRCPGPFRLPQTARWVTAWSPPTTQSKASNSGVAVVTGDKFSDRLIVSMDQYRGYAVPGMFVVNFLGGLSITRHVLKNKNAHFS